MMAMSWQVGSMTAAGVQGAATAAQIRINRGQSGQQGSQGVVVGPEEGRLAHA